MKLFYWRTISVFLTLLISWQASAQFDKGPGTTTLLIGQTWQQEFQDYVSGIGTAPAGSSHYGELYTGTINQGDDGKNFDDSSPYLQYINDNYPGAVVLIAISIKDNPEAGGYGSLNPNSSNYDPNCVYKATRDIAYTSKWDANIKKFGKKFASYPNLKFMVRLGYEVSLLAVGNAAKGMNFGDVLNIYNDQGINIYDIPQDEFYNTVSKDHIDIDAYHDAYNKMARLIRAETSNAKFVYHPVRGFGEVKLLYPGDANVDYVAFSIFNHDISMGTDEDNQVIREIGSDGSRLDSNLEQALEWSTAKKPVIVAEAAYQNAPSEWKNYISSPHNNAFLEYLDRLFAVIDKYDLRSLAYINSDWQSHGWPKQWADSRVEHFSDVKQHWMSNVINNSRYVQYNGETPPPADLAKPTNLTAKVSGTSVTLNWRDNSTTETGVKIQRKKGNGSFRVIYTGSSANQTSYTDTGLEKGATYKYKVAAYNSSTTTQYSNTATAKIDDGSTVGGCSLALGKYTVNFKEQGNNLTASVTVANASDVIIDYGVNGGGKSGYWMTQSGNTFTYTIANVKKGDVVEVGLRVFVNGAQDITPFKTHTVGNCSKVTAVAKKSAAAVKASCTVDLDGYQVVLSENGSNLDVTLDVSARDALIDYSINGGSELGYWFQKSGGKFAYTIQNVNKGDKIHFRIRVIKNDGAQDITGYKDHTVGNCGGTQPPVEDIATPTNLRSSATTSSVTLNWEDKSTAESGHKIERKVGNGSFSQYATVGANVTSYTDNSVTKGNTYSYRVYAYNSSKTSDFSNVVSETISDVVVPPNGEQGKIRGKFTAKTGQTMLIIGQDFGSVQGYTQSGKFPEIAGITQYTNIYDLAGLESSIDYGSGEMNLQKAMDTYPNSALSIGLYMVEDNDGKGEDHPNGLTDIVNGRYDNQITRLANFAKRNAPRPIFLRVGYEFDGPWNHYDPAKYVRAYNYIVEKMNAQGVTNVAYVWQSAAWGESDPNAIMNWYPKAEYVDYVGLSFFFYDENFNGPMLNKLLQIARDLNKPIMMAEVSCQYYELDQNTFHWVNGGASLQGVHMSSEDIWKQYWEDQLLPFVKNNDDVVRCVAYINADWQSQPQWKFPDAGQGFWGDTRIEANSYISQKWNAEITSGFWLNGSSDMLSKLNTSSPRTAMKKAAGECTVEFQDFPYTAELSESGSNVEVTVNVDARDVLIDFGVNGGQELGYWFNKSGNSFVYTIQNVKENDVIRFRLRVMKHDGSQDITEYQEHTVGKCGTTPPPPPGPVTAPKNVSASVSGTTISLTWDVVENAAEYKVFYGTSANNLSQSVTVATNSASISGLQSETTYYMAAIAINSAGTESERSVTVSATTEGTVPPPPPGDKIEGVFTPKNGKTLLAIGQDLASLAGYRNGGLPDPGAVVTYSSFYNNRGTDYGINYGALGVDNGGGITGVDTDWGAGPLNAASSCDGWTNSALIMALSITEHWNPGGLSGIVNGQYNANIDKLAMFCKKYSSKKIYLRIGYEFDGRWNSQDKSEGSPSSGGYHKTGEYKAAFRHIVERMRGQGVTNVAYVWQGSASLVDDVADRQWGGQTTKENIEDWYPGDDVVDWVGFSWFITPDEARNRFGLPSYIPNQDELADDMVEFGRKHNKPVMLAESTPQGYDLEISEYDATPSYASRAVTSFVYEGAKTLFEEGEAVAKERFAPGTWIENMSGQEAWNQWFVPFLDYIHKNSDAIRAVVYINANWNTQGKWGHPYPEGYWGDTRIEANPKIKELWRNETEKGNFWLLSSPSINGQLKDAPAKKVFNTEDTFGAVELKVFPNPSTDNVRILGLNSDEVYRLYDHSGRLAIQGQGDNINVSNLNKGVYFLKVRQQQFKIVKY